MKAINKSVKVIVLFLIFNLIFFVDVDAQSNIYNKKYRLFSDKSLSISENQYKIFSKMERNIIFEIYSNIVYPAIYLENQISGDVILSFEIDTTNKIQNIKIVTGEYYHFNESAIKAVKESSIRIESYLENKSKESETYYIPFEFNCIDYEKIVKESKSVIINQPYHLIWENDNTNPRK